METILTVLITLGVVSLIGSVWGVIRLNGRGDDLEVARMDIDDEIRILRKELEASKLELEKAKLEVLHKTKIIIQLWEKSARKFL